MIYLNNAASSWPKAPGVAEAVARALREPPAETGRGAGGDRDVVADCRQAVARLLGDADARCVAFALNATAALNLAILGCGLKAGDTVVSSVAEHNSVLRPLERLRREAGVVVQYAGLSPAGELDPAGFERLLAARPKLVVLTHASNVTGHVFDIAPLFQRARAAGARTLLDAAQTLGHVPVRAGELEADLVVFTGHKGLLGPQGTGGLWAAPGIELEQVLVGGTGVRSHLLSHPGQMPARLESGTPNLPGLAGLAAALGWLAAKGESLRAAEIANRAFLRERLAAIPGVRIYDAAGGGAAAQTGILSFTLSDWDPMEAAYALEAGFGVHCRAGLHCAPLIHAAAGSAPAGTIRFSVSGFNRKEELQAAADAVGRLSRCSS